MNAKLCECGCGQPTTIARKTGKGYRKGEYHRFAPNHNGRRGRYRDISLEDVRQRTREDANGCWVWQATKTPGTHQYGRVWAAGKLWLAHRYTHQLVRGPIPEGYEIDHLCGNPPCCNPDHLEAVTPGENTRRSSRAKLSWEQVTEIRQLEGENPRIVGERFGVCRVTVRDIWASKTWATR